MKLETLDSGKILADSEGDWNDCLDCLRYFAGNRVA